MIKDAFFFINRKCVMIFLWPNWILVQKAIIGSSFVNDFEGKARLSFLLFPPSSSRRVMGCCSAPCGALVAFVLYLLLYHLYLVEGV